MQTSANQDRNYSFGKGLSLNLQVQGSQNSVNAFESNKVFGMQTDRPRLHEERLSSLNEAREFKKRAGRDSNSNTQRMTSRDILNSLNREQLNVSNGLQVPKQESEEKMYSKLNVKKQNGPNNSFKSPIETRDSKIQRDLMMDSLRRTSNSHLNNMEVKTPKVEGGIKSSVLNFFKLDNLFGRSQERVKEVQPQKNNPKPKTQQIQSTKQVNQKNNYQSNLISEFSVERINESMPLITDPVNSLLGSGQPSHTRKQSKRLMAQNGVSFLQQYTKGNSINIDSGFNIENQRDQNFQMSRLSPRYQHRNKISEITSINMVNPVNKQQKTIFRVKKGPSMQIEFKNKQEKKIIQHDTVADRGTSSDESEKFGNCQELQQVLTYPSKPMQKTIHNSGRVQMTSSRQSNNSSMQINHTVRSKQKLQQLDKLERHSDPDSEINMESEEDDIGQDKEEDKDISNLCPSKKESKVIMFSEFSQNITSLPHSEKKQNDQQQDQEDLLQEYERLQAELLRLKEQQSLPNSPSRQIVVQNDDILGQSTGVHKTKSPLIKQSAYDQQQRDEKYKRNKQNHNRSYMPANYPQEIQSQKHIEDEEKSGHTRTTKKTHHQIESSGHNKSIQLDIKSLNSKLDIQTYAGSKVMDQNDEMYSGRKALNQINQSEKQYQFSKEQRSKRKHRDYIQERMERKQNKQMLKKSFLSDHDKESASNEYDIHDGNYSASASDNEPIQIKDEYDHRIVEKQELYSQRKQKRNHRTSNVHDFSAHGKRSITTARSHGNRNPSKMKQKQKVTTNIKTNHNNLIDNTISPISTHQPMQSADLMSMNHKVFQEYQLQINNLQNQIIQMQNRSILQQQNNLPLNQSSLIGQSYMNQSSYGQGMMPQNNLNNSQMMYPPNGPGYMNMSMQLATPNLNQSIMSTSNQANVQMQYLETIKMLQEQLENQKQQIQQYQEQNTDMNTLDLKSSNSRKRSFGRQPIEKRSKSIKEVPRREESGFIVENENEIEETLNLKSNAGDDQEEQEYKHEISNLMKQNDLTMTLEGDVKNENGQGVKSIDLKSNESVDYRLNENYHKSHQLLNNNETKKNKQSIKNALKQTAGFPSMLDSGIQGINAKNFDNEKLDELPNSTYDIPQHDLVQEEDELPFKKSKVNSIENYDTMTNPEIQSQTNYYRKGKSTNLNDIDQEELDKDKSNNDEDLDKNSKLLIIGFDDKPKGKIPPKLLKTGDFANLGQSQSFAQLLSPKIITQQRKEVNRNRLLKSGNKYKSSQAIDEQKPEIETEPRVHENDLNKNEKDQEKDSVQDDISGIIWPSKPQRDEPAKDSSGPSEVSGVIWPTKSKPQEEQKVPSIKKRDKSQMLISDDLPNLQEVFMKNKNSISVSNRRQLRSKLQSNLQPSQSIQENETGNKVQTLRVSPDQSNFENDSVAQSFKSKKFKTKEELAELRKNMMKKKFNQKSTYEIKSDMSKDMGVSQINVNELNNMINAKTPKQPKGSDIERDVTPNKLTTDKSKFKKNRDMSTLSHGRLPNDNFLARLASGQKGPIDRKEMKQLTSKNYQKLPEIKQKQAEAQKAQEQKAKQERAKKFQKDLDARLRQQRVAKKQQKEKDKTRNDLKEKKPTITETKITETMETMIIQKQGSKTQPPSIQITQKNKKSTNTKESYI